MQNTETPDENELTSDLEEVVDTFVESVDEATRLFSEGRRSLDQQLGQAVSLRGDAIQKAKALRLEAIATARRLESESETKLQATLEEVEAAFHAQLDELEQEILKWKPVSKENSKSPPTKRAAYSDRTSLLMAKLSLLAYDRFEQGEPEREILRRKLEAGGLDLVGTFSEGGTQGFLCKNEKLAVLAFRGTTDLVDWRTNLRAKRAVIKNNNRRVRAHEGFLNAYLLAETQIIDLLSGLSHKLPLYITGHSLGGALAVVASAAIPMEDELTADQIAAVYSFGAPRAGGGDFRQIIKVPHYRVFNPWDIVPSVPPVWFSFQHTGDVRYLAKPDKAPLSRKPVMGGFLSLGLVRAAVLRMAGSDRTAIKQHDINKYVVKLEAIARARNRPVRAG